MREFRIVITPFCNYNCFFCHGESAEECNNLLLRSSDYEFVCRTAKKHLGWNTATITGGEPLISPIFSSVCEKLKAEGISITVVSNASLLARPAQQLKDVDQLNVSLHTMDSFTYQKITQVKYPLENVLNTIVATRVSLPELVIHINYTVIKGMNDSDEEFEKVLGFSKTVNAEVKFIDLSNEDEELATNAVDIVEHLKQLGFSVQYSNDWQFFLVRGEVRTIVTKCPFNGKYLDIPMRDVFIDPNGVLYTSYGGENRVNALKEIKDKDEKSFISKVKNLLPEQG